MLASMLRGFKNLQTLAWSWIWMSPPKPYYNQKLRYNCACSLATSLFPQVLTIKMFLGSAHLNTIRISHNWGKCVRLMTLLCSQRFYFYFWQMGKETGSSQWGDYQSVWFPCRQLPHKTRDVTPECWDLTLLWFCRL